MPNQYFFKARIVPGSGKGREQGIPTLNLDLRDIPEDIAEGIYAARVTIEGNVFPAAVHYGPRPVHGLPKSFEAHLLSNSQTPSIKAQAIIVELVKQLREVRDFESEKELKIQIERDIEEVKTIFSSP